LCFAMALMAEIIDAPNDLSQAKREVHLGLASGGLLTELLINGASSQSILSEMKEPVMRIGIGLKRAVERQ
jgi:hypothetical protein